MMLMSRNATAADKVRRHVALSAGVTALGGLLFGYDTGVVSGALLFVKKDFGGLSSFQEELITSLLLVGAVVGALLAGRVADLIGRRLPDLLNAAHLLVRRLLAAVHPVLPGAAGRADRDRPVGRVGLDGGAALHRRGRAAPGPRRAGQPQPARDHGRDPGLLPDRLRAGRGGH